MAEICDWVKTGGLRGASASFSFSGMRPVPTWKSTAAAPAPIRLGATPLLPCASSPWQLAQETANRSLPSEICDDDEPELADALPLLPRPVTAAYRLPSATSA